MRLLPFLALHFLGCLSGGGPSSDGPSPCADADRDGHLSIACGGDDCDDLDPRRHPDADDFPFDGIDADCDGIEAGDDDGDGFVAASADGDDCDDADPTIHPDAAEVVCDGIDQDCDGADDADGDDDGHDCSAEGGDDCDDADAALHPGSTDVACDGIDQDCDGADLEDADGDGHACPGIGDDCDDRRAEVHPGAVETPCDGVDQDCDGADVSDGDGDGHTCTRAGGDDCDDGAAAVFPGATEVYCNGVDENCDGVDDADHDFDGHACDVDCDDESWLVHPGAVDVYCDGIDQDCADGDYADFDADGDDCVASGGDDCDDADDSIHPGAATVGCDGVDQDCDGTDEDLDADNDGDGYLCLDECDDRDPLVHPGAAESEPVFEQVDVSGLSPVVTVDSAGAVHVLYFQGPDCWIRGDGRCYWVDPLRHATNASGDWVVDTVDPHGERAGGIRSADLRVDADGAVHVVANGRSDSFDVVFNYATNASGSWVRTLLDEVTCIPSMALDADGAVHAMCGMGSAHVYSNETGVWLQSHTIDAPDEAAVIEIDANGARHLLYGDGGEIRYATEASGVWESEVIADSFERQELDLAVTDDGVAHVAYKDGGAQYATNESGAWVTEELEDEAGGGNMISIALDGDSIPHVVWANKYTWWEGRIPSTGGHLRWGSNASGDWATATADEEPVYEISLAPAPDGAVHVVLNYRETGGLWHARVTEAPDGKDGDCDGVVW